MGCLYLANATTERMVNMEGSLKYLSPEWRDEVHERLSTQLDPEKMNYATTSLVSVYSNCPDGKDRYFLVNCANGVLGDVIVGEGEPPEAEFSIAGDYDVFAKMSRGELGAQAALMSGKLKIKGNMVKALKLSSVADRFNRIIATVPTEF
jgi:putative sterol carrier protein